MKVYVVRKYLKRTRWDCNHSTTFEEIEFQTKEEALAYRDSQKKSESSTCTKEKYSAHLRLERRSACELRQDMAIL